MGGFNATEKSDFGPPAGLVPHRTPKGNAEYLCILVFPRRATLQ